MAKKRSGKVYLVGAGPGDPGLITVKGLEILKRADVVLLRSSRSSSAFKKDQTLRATHFRGQETRGAFPVELSAESLGVF